ncbi:hypothetical protein ES703_43186 [subsurface metagenome]
MKKKLYITTIGLVLTLALSGSYAHTYTSAMGTIGIAEPTGNIASVNATETQPDWDSVLTLITDTVILRPDAAGDETAIADQFPASGEHWDKVSENVSDDDSTYVSTGANEWQEDLYDIADHSTQTAAGDINYVKVYMVSKVEKVGDPAAYVHIKTNGVEYNGTEETMTTSYATYSYQWNNNPQTGEAWTWAEIDALQIGVGLHRPKRGKDTLCTQVYTEVSFEAPPLQGDVPTGDLFEVVEHVDYTGDLVVTVYLNNSGNLTKAYQSLNLELYLEGSVEAGETPNYRLLTLENGVATFITVGGGSDNHTLSVTGGTYTLTSREPLEWETGWTVTPELYCEVTQR